MAKKNSNDRAVNFKAEVAQLKTEGPKRMYLLCGQEEYLRERFYETLKKTCLPDGEDDFSYKRINGPELDVNELREAVDAIPFLTDRTFVELRDIDINKPKDPDGLIGVLTDIPDYCTVCFIHNSQFEADNRGKLVKFIKSNGYELKFMQQSQGALIDWIARRFAACGKSVDLEAAQRLIFISGDLMARLIPEIEKVAAYAKGDKVKVSDVDAVAHHIPEANVFELTEYIAQKQYNSAMNLLGEILADDGNEPIFLLAILGIQMRKLYAARIAIEHDLGAKYVMDVCSVRDFVANKLMNAARGFTMEQLKRAVVLCAEADYKMKSSSVDDEELLKEIILEIAAGE